MRVVVIGAGILGASTAWHLSRAGAEVVVIDRAHDGRATAAGAGIVCPWASDASDAAFFALYCAGGRYYETVVRSLEENGDSDLGFRRSGALIVSSEQAELRAFADLLERRQRQTPEMGSVQRIAPRDARTLFPPLDEDLAGVLIAGGARVDGRRITAALLRDAQRHGAVVRDGDAELHGVGDSAVVVRLGEEELPADTIIVAAGVWAPPLLSRIGIRLPVRPQRGQIMHLRLQGQNTDDWPVILPPGEHYLLAFDDSRIVAGATREAAAGFDFRVTAGGQAEVLFEALRVAPGLLDATVIETRVGFRPVSPDGHPLLGVVAGLPGLLVGNGLGAAGLTIGPYAGLELANLALGRTAQLDLSPFDPNRLDLHAPSLA